MRVKKVLVDSMGRLSRTNVLALGIFTLLVIILTIVSFSKHNFFNKSGNINYHLIMSKECSAIRQLVVSEHAMCIDGSKPAFYVRRNPSNKISKWHVHFEGGGWCHELSSCYHRSKERLGSSVRYEQCMDLDVIGSYFSSDRKENPLLYNFHTVYVRYCDGGSFAGMSDQPYENKTLYFRGKANRDATIHALLKDHGMNKASEVLISGCSAGGLGVYLGLDDMADIIKSANSNITVKGLVDSAFFMDHKGRKNKPVPGYDAVINGELDYSTAMKNVFHFMNISAGAPRSCLARHKTDPSKCIFAENILPTIKTPLFALQPLFDHWQLWHVHGQPGNITDVQHFGDEIFTKMSRILNSSTSPGHAVFFDSCAHHCMGCSHSDVDLWNGMEVRTPSGMNLATAFSEWYLRPNENSSSRPSVIYRQEGEYPCKDCCQCSV